MCQIILSISDEVLYDTKMSHEQVNQFARQAYFLKISCGASISFARVCSVRDYEEKSVNKNLL